MESRDRKQTRVGGDAIPSYDRGKTEIYPSNEPSPRGVGDNRKIVGVLITYRWNPNGDMFPVRQGRTHIGAGDIRGEHREVEVKFSQDELMSGDHALVLVQGDNFYLQDLSSVNGTTLGGKPITPEIPEPLPSPAEIKIGDTLFLFTRFNVAAGPTVVRVAEEQEEKPNDWTRAPQ